MKKYFLSAILAVSISFVSCSTFRIKANSDSDNVVEGKFTLPYCK